MATIVPRAYKSLPLSAFPAAKVSRIILHWTAGQDTPNDTDFDHYHFLVSNGGRLHQGNESVLANCPVRLGRPYAAHTRGANSGSIGVAMCGMLGAQQSPFNPGKEPITAKQVDAFCGLVGHLARVYAVPITRKTILSHAEVEGTLGIEQRNKWDIMWLPGLKVTATAFSVGEILRGAISNHPAYKDFFRAGPPTTPAPTPPKKVA